MYGISLSKKNFGKFRILLDSNDESKAQEDNSNPDCSEMMLNCEENSCHSRYENIVDALSCAQNEASLACVHESSQHSSQSNASHVQTKFSKQVKRRGRPAGSTKKDKTALITPQLLLEDELNKRRSSRLKSLEERREQEKAIYNDRKHSENDREGVDDESEPSLTQTAESINKMKKKKSKKDKSKKDKSKEIDSKRGKRKKKLLVNDDAKQVTSDETKAEKCKMTENHKNANNIECFTPPLPPSHYAHIKSNNLSLTPPSNKSATDSDDSPRPEKVKSRWRRNSELESGHGSNYDHQKPNAHSIQPIIIPKELEPTPLFDAIDDNYYLFERRKSKSKKETRRMVCDCILTKEERQRGLIGCGDDCLNRMLMIECGSRCSLGEHCANKRFQKKYYAKVEPFKTAKKGWGLRAMESLPANTFIMEYVGEVVDPFEFHNRVKRYDREKRQHHYFMALKSDEIIDATIKGNITRFVNHSCEPNSETQKWTVNGNLRIGFFTQRFVQAGEEITFDYQFQRYGKKAQKCYCESPNCRGFIGATDTTDIFTDGSRITAKQKIKNVEYDEKLKDDEDILEDLALEEEIAKLAESGGLRNRQQVLMLARLMVLAEDNASRHKLISIIKGTIEIAYLRLLLDYHGLQLIWSWMVEADAIDLKSEILEVLEILPIPNKTMLIDSKVLTVVERWSQESQESQEENVTPRDITPTKISECETTSQIEIQSNTETEAKSETITENENDSIVVVNEENTTIEKEESNAIELKNSIETDSETNEPKENLDVITPIIESLPEDSLNLKQNTTDSYKENDDKTSPDAEMKGTLDAKNKLALLIKPRSAVNSLKSDATDAAVIKPKLSIASMAHKLLISWKDLKEVFRIPRLERQKRHEDEKEADRRTKEVEDRRAKGLPLSFDRRNTDDRDYTIAGILGIRRKGMKRPVDCKDGPNKKVSACSLPANSQSQAPNTIKVSKEEHRKMFEMEVAQKDYHEALKRYHQELAYYNAMYGSHFQQQAYTQNIRMPEPFPPYNYDQYYQNDQNFLHSNICYTMPLDASAQYLTYENEQTIDYNQDITDNNYLEKSTSLPTESVLIPLANFDADQSNFDSCLAIDNMNYDLIFKDDNENNNDSEKVPTFDPTYPPPGVFYLTPDGESYFTPIPVDKKDVTVDATVFNNVTIPQSSPLSNDIEDIKLCNNWRHSIDKHGNIYYYNKFTFKSQWIPPEELEPKISPFNLAIGSNADVKLSDNEGSVSGVEIGGSTSPKRDEIDDSDGNAGHVSVDSVFSVTEKETYVNSLNGSPNLIQSIISLEADPRKRKLILNSNASTTTALADTSLVLPRKRSFSSPRKIQENFRTQMSQYIIHCLNPYRKAECKQGRILNTDDFKYLARKLTHFIMGKEIKYCKSVDELSCNEAVKHKTKDYVKKYMAKFGSFYKPDYNDKVISPKEIVSNDTND